MSIRVVATEDEAWELARRLNTDSRSKPVVVVTTPAQRSAPYIDAGRIAEQVGDLADVCLIRTGPVSWAFSKAMPELTQVYGGAGRVYPVGTTWVLDPFKSPLRFAWGEKEGSATTDRLIADALRMAFEAGLLRRTSNQQYRVGGEVQQLVPPSRALVKTDDHRIVSVWQELLIPDVPIDRILAPGMRVDGLVDLDTKRYDVAVMTLPAHEALAGYRPGVVVLAEVAETTDDAATLRLHPDVVVTVDRRDVSSNHLDRVSSLMTPGEVLAVRVLAAAPAWRLSMLDVDDDEEACRAPSLLQGGPPWLRQTRHAEPSATVVEELPSFVVPETEPVADLEPRSLEPAPATVSEPETPNRPTPLMFDRKRRASTTAPLPADTRALERAVSARRRAEEQAAGLMRQLVDLRNERELLHNELEKSKAQIQRLNAQLKESRAALRAARQKTERQDRVDKAREALFLKAEEQLRHEVLVAWAERIPAADKAQRPLGAYAIGPDFLQSLDALDGIERKKVVDVIVEVLTGLAADLPGREMHPLRASAGGGTRPLVRSDGATCWRVALQTKTPQARRMHFWRLGDGTIELSRVGLHDEYRP